MPFSVLRALYLNYCFTSYEMFMLCFVTLVTPVNSVLCTNYINTGNTGNTERADYNCALGCCITGRSFSYSITSDDVCVLEGDPCQSCLITIANNDTNYNCARSERCCYDKPRFDHTPEHNGYVCSANSVCPIQGSFTEYQYNIKLVPGSTSCHVKLSDTEMSQHECANSQNCCYRNFTEINDNDRICHSACSTSLPSDTCIYRLYNSPYYTTLQCYHEQHCCNTNYSTVHPELQLVCGGDCAWRGEGYTEFYNKDLVEAEWFDVMMAMFIIVFAVVTVVIIVCTFLVGNIQPTARPHKLTDIENAGTLCIPPPPINTALRFTVPPISPLRLPPPPYRPSVVQSRPPPNTAPPLTTFPPPNTAPPLNSPPPPSVVQSPPQYRSSVDPCWGVDCTN